MLLLFRQNVSPPCLLRGPSLRRHILPRSPLTQCCSHKPFVLSSSKHERLNHPPFDRLRVNGFLPFVKGGKNWVSSVYSMLDRFISPPPRQLGWFDKLLSTPIAMADSLLHCIQLSKLEIVSSRHDQRRGSFDWRRVARSLRGTSSWDLSPIFLRTALP